ncbi:MAG: c-type cytochrome [Maritimibacter sp.]|nr:c-type cytochrome [Maritimibacter sp.]
MTATLSTPLPALSLGVLIGLLSLALVANELGKRTGLSRPARVGLSGGLGMGVLAVAIKVVIVSLLTQADGQALAATGTAARTAVEGLFPAPDPTAHIDGPSAQPTRLSTWRALPEAPPDPRGNPTTPDKAALGRRLFHDTNLSADRTLSCASCHVLAEGGDDNARYSTGVDGQHGDRNAPTVLNAAFLTRLFWDGRAASLEAQAEGPLLNPVEMAMPSAAAVVARVRENPDYISIFQDIFPGGDPVTFRNITRAIAAYERTLVTADTAYDRFIRGDDTALSPAAQRGMALFDAIGCRACHMDPVFSAAGTEKPMGTYRTFPVHPQDNPYLERYDLLVDGRPARFRVPSLRNVELTAPYFHNGSVAELEEAIRVMAVSQLGRVLANDPLADVDVVSRVVDDVTPGRNLRLIDNRALSDREVADIAAFLRALSAPSLPQ